MTDQPKKKVLVVDDDEQFCTLLERFLTPTYTVELANNGQQALAAISKEAPAAVLTDIVMPVMDGVELLQKLRSNKATEHLPVIVLLGNASEDDMSKVRNLKANLILAKEKMTRPGVEQAI